MQNYIIHVEMPLSGRGPFRSPYFEGQDTIHREVGDKHSTVYHEFSVDNNREAIAALESESWVCAIVSFDKFSRLFELVHMRMLFNAGFVVRVYPESVEHFQAKDSWKQCIIHRSAESIKTISSFEEYAEFFGIKDADEKISYKEALRERQRIEHQKSKKFAFEEMMKAEPRLKKEAVPPSFISFPYTNDLFEKPIQLVKYKDRYKSPEGGDTIFYMDSLVTTLDVDF